MFVIASFYLFYYESDLLKLRDRISALKELNLTRFFFLLPLLCAVS